ncbi:MAG: YbaK/EbsC family protein [Nitriliruptorales bacterium]
MVSDAVDRFLAAAKARGLDPDVHHWPAGTRTARDAAAAVGCEVGQIVKSLVFVADGRAVVVLTSGSNRVDTGKVAAHLGAAEVRKADAEEARAATGFAIGGTPPLGYPAPLPVLVDRDLLAYEVVWAAAGTPDTTFPVDPHALRDAADGEVTDSAER